MTGTLARSHSRIHTYVHTHTHTTHTHTHTRCYPWASVFCKIINIPPCVRVCACVCHPTKSGTCIRLAVMIPVFVQCCEVGAHTASRDTADDCSSLLDEPLSLSLSLGAQCVRMTNASTTNDELYRSCRRVRPKPFKAST